MLSHVSAGIHGKWRGNRASDGKAWVAALDLLRQQLKKCTVSACMFIPVIWLTARGVLWIIKGYLFY